MGTYFQVRNDYSGETLHKLMRITKERLKEKIGNKRAEKSNSLGNRYSKRIFLIDVKENF